MKFDLFSNRSEAGKLLAIRFQKYKHSNCIVLGIPQGGVPIAFEVAQALDAPLDIILSKKIGHPLNPELAIGAASLKDYFIEYGRDISDHYINEAVKKVQDRLTEMHKRFNGDRQPMALQNKIVIIVDDGVATGNTMLCAIQLIRKSNPQKIVIGTPVISDNAFEKIDKAADEVIALYIRADFNGVGDYYTEFSQLSDHQVKNLLDTSHRLVH
jgi:predicted phosphoribosyltransferase